MSENGEMHVSLEQLQELQSDLNLLSEDLLKIGDLAQSDLTGVGQYWQDGKFEEFSEVYKPQILKINEIAEYYKQWAAGPLEAEIEQAKKYGGWRPDGSGGGTSGGAESSNTSSEPVKNKFRIAEEKRKQGEVGDPGGLERPLPPPQEKVGRNPYYKLERPMPPPQEKVGRNPYYKLERPRPLPQSPARKKPEGFHWDKPYSTPEPPPEAPATPPSTSTPSGFDQPERVRQRLTPEEIALIQKLYGRER